MRRPRPRAHESARPRLSGHRPNRLRLPASDANPLRALVPRSVYQATLSASSLRSSSTRTRLVIHHRGRTPCPRISSFNILLETVGSPAQPMQGFPSVVQDVLISFLLHDI